MPHSYNDPLGQGVVVVSMFMLGAEEEGYGMSLQAGQSKRGTPVEPSGPHEPQNHAVYCIVT